MKAGLAEKCEQVIGILFSCGVLFIKGHVKKRQEMVKIVNSIFLYPNTIFKQYRLISRNFVPSIAGVGRRSCKGAREESVVEQLFPAAALQQGKTRR